MAAAEKRTLTSLMTYALACAVDAFESEHPANRSREPVTAGSPR